MLLSVPSTLDAGYPDEQNEDVQIEISVDPVHDVFMIMVTSHEYDIQSVVAVPKKAARKMPSGRKSNTRSSSVAGLPPKFPQAEKLVEKPTERGRRADCMRPSSPLNRGRSYAIEPRNNSVSRRSRSRQVVMPRQRSGLRRDEFVLSRRSSSTRSNAPLSDSALSRQPSIKTLTDTHNNVEIRRPKSRKVVAPRQRRETRTDESVCSLTMGSRQPSSNRFSSRAESRPRSTC